MHFLSLRLVWDKVSCDAFLREMAHQQQIHKRSVSFCSCSQVGSVEVGRGAGSGKFNISLSNTLLKAEFWNTPLSLILPWKSTSRNNLYS